MIELTVRFPLFSISRILDVLFHWLLLMLYFLLRFFLLSGHFSSSHIKFKSIRQFIPISLSIVSSTPPWQLLRRQHILMMHSLSPMMGLIVCLGDNNSMDIFIETLFNKLESRVHLIQHYIKGNILNYKALGTFLNTVRGMVSGSSTKPNKGRWLMYRVIYVCMYVSKVPSLGLTRLISLLCS